MKLRTLGILAALALALSGFIALYERKLPSTSERREQSRRAISFDAAQTREILLEATVPAGRIRFERQASAAEDAPRAWWVREPLVARADGFAIDRFLQSLGGIESVRRLEDADRQQMGLVRPRFSVTLRGDFGERTLDVGAALPVGGTVAVAVRGDRAVSIVADTIVAEFAKPSAEWRSRELFTASRDEIEGLTVLHHGQRVVMERRGEVFTVTAPYVDRADRDRVNELLSELASLRATDFLVEGGGDLQIGPDSPTVEVRVKGRAEPLRVELGPLLAGAAAATPAEPAVAVDGAVAPPVKHRMRVDGVMAEVETALADALTRPAAAWRSTHWSAFEVYRVESLAAVAQGESWTLSRQGSDWKRGNQVLPYGPVSDLLYAVTTAKAREVLSRAEAAARGFDFGGGTQLSVRLGAKDGEEESLTLLTALPGGEVPAISSAREVVLLLAAETAQEILEKAQAVRAAEPLKGGTADE